MSFFPPQSGQERSSTSATNSAPQSRQRARPASVSTRRGTPSYSVPSVTATQQSVRKRGTTPESDPTRTVMLRTPSSACSREISRTILSIASHSASSCITC